MTTTSPLITVPASAVIGSGSSVRAFLTEREAVALVKQDGYTDWQIQDLLTYTGGGSFGLSTGAKITQVPAFQRGKVSTRARVWQVYGYHYAGTDVTDLIAVAA